MNSERTGPRLRPLGLLGLLARYHLATWTLLCASAGAFESNEHREIGNCAIGVVLKMVELRAAPPAQGANRTVDEIRRLLPDTEKGRGALCELPADTNGLADWLAVLSGSKSPIAPDEPARRSIWVSDKRQLATYGHLAALVDSYVFAERLLATPGRAVGSELPRAPAELFRNGGKLPWPEDIRAVEVNDSHFRGLAVVAFQSHHKRAKEAARAGNLYGALVANALADHYLLDLLAPGHVMGARQTIPGEIALAMHDYANKTGVNFVLDEEPQRQNLLVVLDFVHRHFEALFGREAIVRTQPNTLDESMDSRPRGGLTREQLLRRAEAARSRVRDQLEQARQWSDAPIVLRGDNFLTDKTMADHRLGEAATRQYLFVVAAQVLSIMDVLCSFRDGQGSLDGVCAKFDAKAIAAGFGPGNGANSGTAWTSPEPKRDGDKWRIETPLVRICCGTYAFVDVAPDLFALTNLTVAEARRVFKTDEPERKKETPEFNAEAQAHNARYFDKGRYRYLESDWIFGIDYQRQYTERLGRIAPRALAMSMTTLLKSYSGEVLQLPDAGSGEIDLTAGQAKFDSSWTTGSAALRVDRLDRPRQYGLEARFVRNFGQSPWRWGDFWRYGRYHDEAGRRRSDNGAGLLLEVRTTLLRFAVTGGSRGFPMLSRDNRHYGFEVGLFLPSSRMPGSE